MLITATRAGWSQAQPSIGPAPADLKRTDGGSIIRWPTYRLLPTYHWGNRDGRVKPDSPLVLEVLWTFAGSARPALGTTVTRQRAPERVFGPRRFFRGVTAALQHPDAQPSSILLEVAGELRCEIDIRRERAARLSTRFRKALVSASERADLQFPYPPRTRYASDNGAVPPNERTADLAMARTPKLRYVDPYKRRGRLYLALCRFSATKAGALLAVNVAWKLDPHLLKLTRGRLGTGGPLATALLESRGARTGQPRRNATLYFHDGDRVTIIASKRGAPKNPAWYYNLRKHPDIVFGRLPFRAEIVADEAERQRLWDLADRVFPEYADYRERAGKAGRVIPIVQLVPR